MSLSQLWLPLLQRGRKKQSHFDPYAPYVLKRWDEGIRNGLTLWEEIKAQRYTGSSRMVYRFLATLKQAQVQTPVDFQRHTKFTATTAVWLFVRDAATLDPIQREALSAFCCNDASDMTLAANPLHASQR